MEFLDGNISIHALREEGDLPVPSDSRFHRISIHALREEGDAFFLAIALPPFLISIHALREEGDFRPCRDRACAGAISIHALREEGDPRSCSASPRPWNFYPRPPRGGRRVEAVRDMLDGVFLSTPSARRATGMSIATDSEVSISIHALREEGDSSTGTTTPDSTISIHALREEGDQDLSIAGKRAGLFLSTPSARRATLVAAVRPQCVIISIHALREEGDGFNLRFCRNRGNFYPRPPRGGRLFCAGRILCQLADFYPRPPRGGRHQDLGGGVHSEVISIHALREEGDGFCWNPCWRGLLFLSTPSARRATQNLADQHDADLFLSTPSARRATPAAVKSNDNVRFLSTPSARRATRSLLIWKLRHKKFLSTPSARRAT